MSSKTLRNGSHIRRPRASFKATIDSASIVRVRMSLLLRTRLNCLLKTMGFSEVPMIKSTQTPTL